jgi:hypothetical protein
MFSGLLGDIGKWGAVRLARIGIYYIDCGACYNLNSLLILL